MPHPKKGEKREQYIARCIPQVLKEGTAKDNKQAAAICYSFWDKAHPGDKALDINAVIEGRELVRKALSRSRQVYKFNEAGDLALDALPTVATVDKGKMAVTVCFSTQNPDRSQDVVVTRGIITEAHAANPVVYWNHALTGLDLPIGKAMDPDGLYTVVLQRDKAFGTTYFSQSLPEAEQIFRLIDEGCIRGASIGFRALKAYQRDDEESGALYESVELCEYSHVGLPDNAEALTTAIHKGRLGALKLSDPVLKGLVEYAIPLKTSVIGGFSGDDKVVKTKTKTKTAPEEEVEELDEAHDEDCDCEDCAKRLKKKDATIEENAAPKVEVANPALDETKDGDEEVMSFGAKALQGVYDRCAEIADFIGAIGLKNDQPDVLKSLTATTRILEDITSKLGEQYADIYPELEPIHVCKNQEQTEGEAQDQGEGEGQEEVTFGKAKLALKARIAVLRTKRAPRLTAKRITKSQHKVVKEAHDFMTELAAEEYLTKTHKTCLSFHSKALEDAVINGNQEAGDLPASGRDEETEKLRAELVTKDRLLKQAQEMTERIGAAYRKLKNGQ